VLRRVEEEEDEELQGEQAATARRATAESRKRKESTPGREQAAHFRVGYPCEQRRLRRHGTRTVSGEGLGGERHASARGMGRVVPQHCGVVGEGAPHLMTSSGRSRAGGESCGGASEAAAASAACRGALGGWKRKSGVRCTPAPTWRSEEEEEGNSS